MKLEMTELEYLELFGIHNYQTIHERDFVVNGEKYKCQEWLREKLYFHTAATITLILVKPLPIKSPQELSAEESVKKAEEALRAAKEVLNKVKENHL